MDWAGWATFGLGATVLLTVVMMGAQLAGLSRMDLPLILGTMLVADPDRARVAGFFIHLAMGQIFAFFYLAAFAALGWSTWWLGGLFGLFHGFVALVVIMPLVPGVHPRMASDRSNPGIGAVLQPPGPLGIHYGTQTPVWALAAHVAYGVALGVFLQPG